jgi:hypothetical protein
MAVLLWVAGRAKAMLMKHLVWEALFQVLVIFKHLTLCIPSQPLAQPNPLCMQHLSFLSVAFRASHACRTTFPASSRLWPVLEMLAVFTAPGTQPMQRL